MAKKELFLPKRQDILRLHGALDKRYSEIAHLTIINLNAVARVNQRFKYDGRGSNLAKNGRPSMCTDRMRRAFLTNRVEHN
uniref:Putative transposase n=1 Tax=Anopheles triannulatus TaxID=58253 RepID=A0A2M4B0C5_9DIPT